MAYQIRRITEVKTVKDQESATVLCRDFTKGPWKIGRMHKSILPNLQNSTGNDGFTICRVYGEGKRRANARLIAAAPELLAALEAVLSFGVVEDDNRIPYITCQIDREAIGEAQAVIAKALDAA